MASVVERAMHKGEVVTVVKRNLRTVEIRDKFGFVSTVPKRSVKRLKEDDEHREFHIA